MKEKQAPANEIEPRVKLLCAIMAQQKKLQAQKTQPSPDKESSSISSSSTTAAATADSSGPSLPPDTSLSTEQSALLKRQIDAYRSISKSVPISADKAQALLANSLTDEEKQELNKTTSQLDTVTGRAIEALHSHINGSKNGSATLYDQGDTSVKQKFPVIDNSVFADKLPQLIPLISPYSLLQDKLKVPEQAGRLQRLLVPSITPAGLDPHMLAKERENRRSARIQYRIEELESLPANLTDEQLDVNYPIDGKAQWRPGLISSPDTSNKLKAIIELKSLRLRRKAASTQRRDDLRHG